MENVRAFYNLGIKRHCEPLKVSEHVTCDTLCYFNLILNLFFI